MIILNVPGYDSSGPNHWQTWLENTYRGFERVEQDNWFSPVREVWLERLDSTIKAFQEPVFLLAHSCGSVCTAQWLAERYREGSRVLGAILVAPADVENSVELPGIGIQSPLPHTQFVLPTHVIASTNDPYCSLERSRQLAREWGSSLEFIHGGGHLASNDGYGPWEYLVEVLEEKIGTKLIKR